VTLSLLHFIKRFDKLSSHHIAAFNALQDALPPELLERNAEWISIFEGQSSEYGYNEHNVSDK
jgi:hypothetical protein